MKTLIITVEDTEEEIFDRILSVLNTGKNVFKAEVVQKPEKLTFSDFTIDIGRRVIERKGQDIYMPFIEFEVLQLLARNARMVFSKEQIYNICLYTDCRRCWVSVQSKNGRKMNT